MPVNTKEAVAPGGTATLPEPWHTLSPEATLVSLATSDQGLSDQEAAERLQRHGRNVLPVKQPPTVVHIFLHQFLSPLIYILLGAGLVAILMGDSTDAFFIFGVVLLNAALGCYQEWKAERSAAGLQKLLRVTARVRRSGEVMEKEAEELVPGDVVLLESGAKVPADVRLLEANNLTIDEALLTGESLAVEKHTLPLTSNLPVGDRRNMAFAGSMIVTGRGTGVVVATGLHTEVGTIATSVTAASTVKPPLVIRMEKFSRQVSLVVVVVCLLLGGVAFSKGMPLTNVFFLAVALAVSAIPEGLPVAMTVALSIATSRMAKRNVIVRKLTAVEGLGSCTFIASDKTGTLTLNKQTVKALWLPTEGLFGVPTEGESNEPLTDASGRPAPAQARELLHRLCRLSMICNEAGVHREAEAWRFSGDAVDVAFWDLSLRLGIDPSAVTCLQRIGQIPFESERAYSASFFLEEGRIHVAVKGAPEALLGRCVSAWGSNGPVPLDLQRVEAELASLTAAGYRVMAVAFGVLPGEPEGRDLGEEDLPPLALAGLVGLIDPPRIEVKEAIATCRQAGIEVAMVTGDHPLTALAIARSVGLEVTENQVVTGRQLAAAGSPESKEFAALVRQSRVFARVSPLQKLQIVDVVVKSGHFAAVTGDGVNDAPALKRANIGVAMGSGSDIAKETASIIVTDDNFASIVAGVEEGRFAYDNIRKVTYLLIATGFAEVLLFLAAILSGMPIPLVPVQLLWLNLVTNGIQDVALAFEGGEPGAIRRQPRPPSEGIFNRLMVEQVVASGTTIAVVAYASFYYLLNVVGLSEWEARSRLLLLMVLLENYHVFNCRSEYASAFRVPLRRNWLLLGGVLGAQALHQLAMYTPFGPGVLQTSPIGLSEWISTFASAASVLLVMELFKLWRHGRKIYWA
jgi:P-type Ca2+ transporter type 2C